MRGRRRTVLAAVAAALAMAGLTYASVPLYRLFCQTTGFDGTPLRGPAPAAAAAAATGRRIEVRFDANTDPALDWTFRPEQGAVTAVPGTPTLVFFQATNNEDRPVTGRAAFNVTPEKSAQYFVKVACFCFQEQTLQPGESVDMPVSFYIDPAIAGDRDEDEVRAVTLSYTFFRAQEQDPGGTTTGRARPSTGTATRATLSN